MIEQAFLKDTADGPRGRALQGKSVAGLGMPAQRLVGMSGPTMVRATVVPELAKFARTLGVDVTAVAVELGIDCSLLEESDKSLPMRSLVQMFERIAELSGTPDFGLRLAQARGLPDFGPVTLVLREQSCLREALMLLKSFLHVQTDALMFALEERESAVLVLNMFADGERNDQTIASFTAGVVTLLRWIMGEAWAPASITLAQSRPQQVGSYTKFFRCTVDFDQDINAIVFNDGDLDRALPRSSAMLQRQAERCANFVGADPGPSFSYRVRQAVVLALPNGTAHADVIASHFNINRRTLHRRLASENSTFSEMVESVRRDLTIQYMASSQRALCDIAQLTGFACLSTFSRWFKGSFEMAPRSWRRCQASQRPN